MGWHRARGGCAEWKGASALPCRYVLSLTLPRRTVQYLIPWARVGVAGKSGRDPKLAQELWAWLEEQVAKHV